MRSIARWQRLTDFMISSILRKATSPAESSSASRSPNVFPGFPHGNWLPGPMPWPAASSPCCAGGLIAGPKIRQAKWTNCFTAWCGTACSNFRHATPGIIPWRKRAPSIRLSRLDSDIEMSQQLYPSTRPRAKKSPGRESRVHHPNKLFLHEIGVDRTCVGLDLHARLPSVHDHKGRVGNVPGAAVESRRPGTVRAD